MGSFTLRLYKEAGSKGVFKSLHDRVMVGEKNFVLIEGFLFDGFTPLFRLLAEDVCLVFAVTVRSCVDSKHFAGCGWREEVHFLRGTVLVD